MCGNKTFLRVIVAAVISIGIDHIIRCSVCRWKRCRRIVSRSQRKPETETGRVVSHFRAIVVVDAIGDLQCADDILLDLIAERNDRKRIVRRHIQESCDLIDLIFRIGRIRPVLGICQNFAVESDVNRRKFSSVSAPFPDESTKSVAVSCPLSDAQNVTYLP